MQEFELRRRSDGLVYRFARDGVGVYRRTDRPETGRRCGELAPKGVSSFLLPSTGDSMNALPALPPACSRFLYPILAGVFLLLGVAEAQARRAHAAQHLSRLEQRDAGSGGSQSIRTRQPQSLGSARDDRDFAGKVDRNHR